MRARAARLGFAAALVDAGYRTANSFFIYFVSSTGLHFAQVCFGLILIGVPAIRAGRPPLTANNLTSVENCCIYWHLVDATWLILFSLLDMAS